MASYKQHHLGVSLQKGTSLLQVRHIHDSIVSIQSHFGVSETNFNTININEKVWQSIDPEGHHM